MALRKALHCAVDGEDDEGSKHHFPLGLHNENNREHAASGVNSSSLFIRWSAQLRQPFLCAPSSDNGTRLPHHSPNQTERGGHRSISYLSAYGWPTHQITTEAGCPILRFFLAKILSFKSSIFGEDGLDFQGMGGLSLDRKS